MLFFKTDENNNVTEISEDFKPSREWKSRWDFKSMEMAGELAASATNLTGELHIPVDSGPCVSPRYDIIKAIKVGDPVSYGFNGDYYPDGHVVSISASLRVITTTTGNRYYRRRQTACWVKTGGTWALVRGHCNDKNPHF